MVDHDDDSWLLHARAYRDTSLLVELFTRNRGRVGAVVNDSYQKKTNLKALLQPFSPLRVVLQGKSDLLRLSQVDACARPLSLSGNAQACGFYVNELLMYCLPRHDPQPTLYVSYQHCLQQLQTGANIAAVLRVFELALLSELGYGINFLEQAQSHCPIDAEKYYTFLPLSGFHETLNLKGATVFLGAHLRAIQARDLVEREVNSAARRLTQLALAPLLNGRVIHSRALLLPAPRT